MREFDIVLSDYVTVIPTKLAEQRLAVCKLTGLSLIPKTIIRDCTLRRDSQQLHTSKLTLTMASNNHPAS